MGEHRGSTGEQYGAVQGGAVGGSLNWLLDTRL